MKVIIAGSRNIQDYQVVVDAIEASGYEITEAVSGCCRGPDLLGEQWAAERQIPISRFPADWDLYGRSAGPVRNSMMARYADAAILIWDGSSKGTQNMKDQMTMLGKPAYMHDTSKPLSDRIVE